MHQQQWVLYHRELSKQRKNQLEKLRRKAKTVIQNPQTKKLCIDVDFPKIDQYLRGKFPEVDISDVDVYATSPQVFNRAWKGMGGCYIDMLKSIFVKDDHEDQTKGKQDKFQKLMGGWCKMSVDIEDVLVHELIHAVSHKIGRASSKYRHMEEEFVYTNCIDFYHDKGMTDDEIVDNNFLPFCVHDVYSSRSDLNKMFFKIDTSLSDVQGMTNGEYKKFLSKHAEILVPAIVIRARERAHHMIEVYHKYGADMYRTAPINSQEDKTSLRFSSLDLD